MKKIIDSINSPDDLKSLKISELRELAEEIREIIINTTCKTGGHVSPSLGAVEIAIAVHYVFDSPKDRIVWDVGHQAYAHKILTGRKNRFHTLRTLNGISGFNNIFESEHDALTVGHAATSMSAALGMAIARDLKGEDYSIVNIIGDGSMTNGLVYEAMNNIAHLRPRMIIILNDNKMSISENVGGISQYLNKLETTNIYTSFKNELWELLGLLPNKLSSRARDLARRLKESLKNFVIPTILFEEFGIRYIGPINGHDIKDLIQTLKAIKRYNGPILIHALTQKGKGYSYAEDDPTKFHGLGQFCVDTGKKEINAVSKPKYTDVFGKTLIELTKDREDVVAITAAMPDGTGLIHFQKAYPNRFFDVGIAEGHAVEFAVGLSLRGIKPVCAIYSTFLQRAYDQLIHDASLMNQNIFFVLDRGGIVGEDGPTHHGLFDLSYLRTVPNMVIMSPKDENELKSMIKLGLDYNKGPIAMRYPRGEIVGVNENNSIEDIEIGKMEVIQKGKDIVVFAIGVEVYYSIYAAEKLKDENINITIINVRFLRPFDRVFAEKMIKKHSIIITAEENIYSGGMGELINGIIANMGVKRTVKNIAIMDQFVKMGKQKELRHIYKLDEKGIYDAIKEAINEHSK